MGLLFFHQNLMVFVLKLIFFVSRLCFAIEVKDLLLSQVIGNIKSIGGEIMDKKKVITFEQAMEYMNAGRICERFNRKYKIENGIIYLQYKDKWFQSIENDLPDGKWLLLIEKKAVK